jgi:hypothetical protein
MLTRRFFRFALPLAALAGAAVLVTGCRRGCGWRHDPGRRADWAAKKIASELGLDAAQKARLDSLKSALLSRRDEFRSLRAGMKDLLLTQLRSDKVDTAVLNRALEEREAKLRELRGFLAGEFAEFHAMLTPAQREKLAAKVEKFGRHCR